MQNEPSRKLLEEMQRRTQAMTQRSGRKDILWVFFTLLRSIMEGMPQLSKFLALNISNNIATSTELTSSNISWARELE
uniref:Uncharacterized protein n=1 Tax=Cucumis sativus TaxID=3659 RepID=A0A0A0L8G2_CUCSA